MPRKTDPDDITIKTRRPRRYLSTKDPAVRQRKCYNKNRDEILERKKAQRDTCKRLSKMNFVLKMPEGVRPGAKIRVKVESGYPTVGWIYKDK